MCVKHTPLIMIFIIANAQFLERIRKQFPQSGNRISFRSYLGIRSSQALLFTILIFRITFEIADRNVSAIQYFFMFSINLSYTTGLTMSIICIHVCLFKFMLYYVFSDEIQM